MSAKPVSDMDNTFIRDQLAEEAKSSKSLGKTFGQGASDSQRAVASRKRYREKREQIEALEEAESLAET